MHNSDKGQLISKTNCQAVNSSKKRTNEFGFTTMQRVFVTFLKKLKTSKKPFEITSPFDEPYFKFTNPLGSFERSD